MKTRPCNFCGLRFTLKPTMVWNWRHFSETGKWIKSPIGPLPCKEAVIQTHENHCARDMMYEHYGTLQPLEKWTKS